MKAFELRAFGLENLQPAERATPEPGPGEALIRIRACSLNYRDLMIVQGKYNPRMKLPRVAAVGMARGRLSRSARTSPAGTRATAWVVPPSCPTGSTAGPDAAKSAGALGGNVDGMLREFATIRADALVAIPDHLSFEEASTLPCAAVTAWNGLFVSGNLRPGETLLLQGTGGVSLFGLQFGLAAGATIILTSSSEDKMKQARALGAHHTTQLSSRAGVGQAGAGAHRRARRRPHAGGRRRGDALGDAAGGRATAAASVSSVFLTGVAGDVMLAPGACTSRSRSTAFMSARAKCFWP